MDNIVEEFLKKKNVENILLDNNILTSYEECSFRSNNLQSNLNTTKGRINTNEFTNNYNINATKNNEKDSSKRLTAIKKCFRICKDKNELNKEINNKCKNIINENKEKEYLDKKYKTNENEIFSNTCNSFFKRNVDNFINNYLKNKFYVNENINTLNNNEENNNCQIKNITVNKNTFLYNIMKTENNNINNEKKIKKISTKKYINVNRIEALKMKNNNYILKIKNMFNNKEELIKNNSFCKKYTVNSNILNSKKNQIRKSLNFNSKNNNNKSLNETSLVNKKTNINLRKINSQNNYNNCNQLKSKNEGKNNLRLINNKQKLSCRHNIPKNLIELMNINNSERNTEEKTTNRHYNNKLNYMMTSPALYNMNNSFYFRSPNLASFRKININSPNNENLSFSYKSLKGKTNNLFGKEIKILNQDNKNEEIFKINQIYTKTNSSNKRINIYKKKSNSKNKRNKYNLSLNEDSFNIIKSPIIDNSFGYFSKISHKNDSAPYIISHIDTTLNSISGERTKEKKIKKNFFNEIEMENKSPKINTNIKINKIINENKNKDNKLINKNIINKHDQTKYNSNKNQKSLKKPLKITLQSNRIIKKENKNIINDKNKPNYDFFNKYDSLKNNSKLLRERHFSDFENSFLDKTLKINRKINNNNIVSNKENFYNKSKKENKMNLNKNKHENKYHSNNINKNKKPFSISSARDNNYKFNNIKNEKFQDNIKKMKFFINSIEKIVDFYGNNKENHLITKKYLQTYNNIKNKDLKKSEKNIKHKKNYEGLRNFNISKLKFRPNNKNCFIQKYYNYVIKKENSNNCFISKIIYKKELEFAQINLDKINGGLCPFMNKIINASFENNFIQSKENIANQSNSLNNQFRKMNLNIKSNSHIKINKSIIKNQLNINTTSLLEYKELNKKIKLNEQNEENSFLNNDEESEVTFGRKEKLISNKKSLSNERTKNLKVYDLKNNENINLINDNTFCFYNNEFENEYKNKDNVFDEESFVNGETNYLNNSLNPNDRIVNSNNGTIFNHEIKSMKNNIFNTNNIIFFSPKQKQIYLKYKEKAFMIISNIFLKYKISTYKNLKNYFILQKNKNKNEYIIYTKKRLKDNGGKLYESISSESSKKQYNFTDKDYINENNLLINSNEKSFFEKKKNNFIKKLKIRTKSSDYIIFDKNDKSVIKKIEINLKDINNKKFSRGLNTSFNTPKNNRDEKNVISPHFIDNKEINKKMENINNNCNNKEYDNKIEKIIINLKNFDCTPKFFQNKPKYIEDTKYNNNLKENKKKFNMEEIFYIGSSNSYCFKENLLTNNFITHCDEMLKNVEIINIDKIDNICNRDIQNKNKYEILYLLNKITSLNFDIILDKLKYLIIKENNNQYIFIKLLLNKVIKEKKYISLYANLCFNLYKNILNKVNNEINNNNQYSNQNLGFDNDLKNILNNECKLKFNIFINEIKLNEIKSNIKYIKNKMFCFFDFILELVKMKLLLFENIIYYFENLYKVYINNNNGNNISILYFELILYLLEKTIEKIRNICNIKNYEIFKKLIEEKIIIIFENSELLENYLKYKIINIKEKLKIFLENNNSISEKISVSKEELYIFDYNINEKINNILLNNKREENIKLLIINDLENYIKIKNDKINNINDYNWIIIDELIFEIHINLLDIIICLIEICKEKKIYDKNIQFEYFDIVLNYFIQYLRKCFNYKKEEILKILSKICSKNEDFSDELFVEKLGYIFFLLLKNNLISINDINYFINKNIEIKQNIVNILNYALLFNKEKYNKNIKTLQNTEFFINNENLFNTVQKIFI